MTDSGIYHLRTARLGFRSWMFDDLPLASALWGDAEVARFIGGPFSDQQIRHRFDEDIALMQKHGVQYWPMFLLPVSDEAAPAHAGCGGLRPYKLESRVYEIGVHLYAAYWGQGLAEEASRAIINYGFETVGAEALFAGHHPENAASHRLLKKLGFRFTHTELYAPTGLQHPSYLLERSRR